MTEHRTDRSTTFGGNDRFEILREIGAGGMGVVFEAVDREQDSRVALKTMQRLRPLELYRFKQEFRSLANIVHPNLIRLYELVSDGREWFYTMELVDGVDFLAWVRPMPEISEVADDPTVSLREESAADLIDFDRLRRAFLQLVEGIHTLHRKGKLHRDIKPSNVLVRGDGRVQLLDFGLVKDLGDESESGDQDIRDSIGSDYSMESIATDGRVVGSIPYMAPEQAAGGTLTEACDWYAVGVILFEALTGARPFAGAAEKILLDKQQRDPQRADELVPGLPADLVDLCHRLLSRNPSDRPTGHDLLEALGVDHDPSDDSAEVGDLRLPFIGREHHLETLDRLYGQADSQACMLHLHGPSGVGKSALANRFLVGLEDEGDTVILAGRCYEQESVPYKALDSLVDSLSRHLLQMPTDQARELVPPDIAALGVIFPVLERVEAVRLAPPRNIPDPFELRRVAFESLAELLRRLGEQRRVVLYIDDLQWGDVDSAVFLRELIESRFPPRLLFVASYRSEYRDRSPCLRALPGPQTSDAERVLIDELLVGPLGREEARSLAVTLLDEGHEAADADRIAVESGGNPYFVYELTSAAKLDLQRDGGDTELSQLDLDQALWARVQSLRDTPRRLLEAIAVSSRPIPLRNVYEAVGINSSGQPGLAELRSGHLIRRSGPGLDDEIESFHDRIRESIIEHLDDATRRRHHLGLARSLEGVGGADPETIAIHYHGAGEMALAGGFYEQAAEQAVRALAFDRAAKLFRETIALRDLDPTDERRLRVKLADALANAGRGAESAREYLAAAEGLEGDEAFRLHERAGYQFCVAGHIDEGRESFRGVLDHIGLKLPPTRRAALLSLIGRRLVLMLRGTRFRRRKVSQITPEQIDRIDLSWEVAGGITMIDPIPAADLQNHNLLLALKAGEPFRISRALAWEASHVAMIGQRFRGTVERLLGEAAALADELDEPMARGTVDLARSVAGFFLCDFEQSRLHGDRAAKTFRDECVGAAWELDQSLSFPFWDCYYMGDLADLADRQGSLLTATRERGAVLAESQLTTFGGPFVWLAADDPQGALEAIAGVENHWRDVEYQVYHFTLLSAKSEIALYEGRAAEALEAINREWPLLRGALLLHVEIVRTYMHYLRGRAALATAVEGGESAEAVEHARRSARVLSRMKPHFARGGGHSLRAALAHREGDDQRAVGELEKAVHEFDADGMGLYANCARYRLGTLIGGDMGRELVEGYRSWAAEQGVKNPERMAAVNAPGFED
jgi:serine/threonine protein kinase